MASETGIVNIALARINAERISSLDSGTTKQARVARDLFDEARDELFRKVTWNFCTKRVELSQAAGSGSTPAFGYDYAYTLPADFLRMISVHPSDSHRTSVEYQLETQVIASTPTRVLISNSNKIYVRYVAQITDVNLMTPLFRSVLSAKLALDIGRALDRSSTDFQVLMKEYKDMLAHARSIDGIEDFPEPLHTPSWVSSRFTNNDYWRSSN